MIKQEHLSLEWINKKSADNKADNILIEKVIRALLLLEGLAKQKIPFVFKGGTSLMLHTGSTKRFSIDIDILLTETVKDLDIKLENIIDEQGFLRKELVERKQFSKIRKEHYKFYYVPLYKTKKDEEYVLLDILHEQNNYCKTELLPVTSHFTPVQGRPLKVFVPCLEDLLGDKLTAFAPNTTGIPYIKSGKSMSMEIIKQLYDIECLFDKASDIEIIKKTFYNFAKTELSYRNSKKNAALDVPDVLDDIFQTAFCIASRGVSGKGNFKELQKGLQSIKGYIFSESYHLEKAIISASKAAYLATLIKYDEKKIEKYTSPAEIKNWKIDGADYIKMNRLKKSSPEAFFYWFQIYSICK